MVLRMDTFYSTTIQRLKSVLTITEILIFPGFLSFFHDLFHNFQIPYFHDWKIYCHFPRFSRCCGNPAWFFFAIDHTVTNTHVVLERTLNILLSWSISDFPGNSGFLVRNSANIQPQDHMSIWILYNWKKKGSFFMICASPKIWINIWHHLIWIIQLPHAQLSSFDILSKKCNITVDIP